MRLPPGFEHLKKIILQQAVEPQPFLDELFNINILYWHEVFFAIHLNFFDLFHCLHVSS